MPFWKFHKRMGLGLSCCLALLLVAFINVGSSSEYPTKPLQLMFDGLYFPIPDRLERYLVPTGDSSIRLQVDCDLFDMKTARRWISAME